MISAKPPKAKRCKACKQSFVPTRLLQSVCSPVCAHELVKMNKLKSERAAMSAERKETKARLLELKPLQYWLKRAEKAVNALRRAQDLAAGYGCITCGTHDAEEWHAGHWISVGASSALRFTYTNIHLQCRQCNYFGAGKAQEYEARLPARIGQAEVDRLKFAPRSRRWTREECQAIEAQAKADLKALKGIPPHAPATQRGSEFDDGSQRLQRAAEPI